jgi:hypothetical protein
MCHIRRQYEDIYSKTFVRSLTAINAIQLSVIKEKEVNTGWLGI